MPVSLPDLAWLAAQTLGVGVILMAAVAVAIADRSSRPNETEARHLSQKAQEPPKDRAAWPRIESRQSGPYMLAIGRSTLDCDPKADATGTVRLRVRL